LRSHDADIGKQDFFRNWRGMIFGEIENLWISLVLKNEALA
jgi:hypothetical protein